MAGELVPLVLLPRYSTFSGAHSFTTIGMEVSDYSSAIVNVWRSIKGTVRHAPLALCDASSVAPGDLIPVERRARERIGEIQLAVHSPGHRWFYFPEMRPDEVLLLKTYDSAADGRARFTIHTSFDDPNAAADAPSRESIETRCFVFF